MFRSFRSSVLGFCVTLTTYALAQSPGGYATNLRAWYKANSSAYRDGGSTLCTNGQTVRQWNDRSGNNLNMTQSSSSQRPTWYDGSGSVHCNYNPSLRFSDHYLQRSSGTGVLVNGTTYNKLNLYAVYHDNSASNFDWLFTAGGNNGLNRVSLSMNYGGSADFDCDVISTSNRVTPSTNTALPIGRTNIIAVKSDNAGIFGGSPSSANVVQAFCNGAASVSRTTRTPITANNSIAQIGDNELVTTDATDEPFGGDAMEFILYTGSVSQAMHERIETYLALKYSVTLSGHDYFNSAGTNIFALSGGYTNDIIGVIRDDGQAIEQKQSRQQDDSTRIHIGSLASTNAGNSSSMGGNLRSVVVGHNGAAMRSSAGTAFEVPSGGGLYSRIAREWKVTNTAYTGTFGMNFRLNTSPIIASDLCLLVDDDGDFSNASVNGTPQGLTFTYSGGVVSVTGISTTLIPANATRYITIASTSSATPLPVELLYFKAELIPLAEVATQWATATERNNDHFEVERSIDGILFERIGEMAGQGNAEITHTYTLVDHQPAPGLNYYRLKQVDLDGSSTYSEVQAVMVEHEEWTVYPNPAHDHVSIKGYEGSLRDLVIHDAGGRRVPLPQGEARDGRLDVSTLARGIYIGRLGDRVIRIVKE
ncbi:MAG: T9SS type A sorting domain-containing protein [Flavobacteriales bacterium]|jgi:hypothetical protein|nr:T9SS type A sorting domain-containing protein [Flavobacteriales bacterium]